MTKNDAIKEIAGRVCTCFGEIDLAFATGIENQGSADGLRFLARRWGLNRAEIWQEIYPVIRHWLDNSDAPFGEIHGRPWRADPERRRLKATQMATDAAWHFADK